MKKILCMILALMLLLSCAACDNGEIKAATEEQVKKYNFTASANGTAQVLSWDNGADLKTVSVKSYHGDQLLGEKK